jgi:hypothetical protein
VIRAALLCVALFAGAAPQSSPVQSSQPQSRPAPVFFALGAVVKPGPRPLVPSYTLFDMFADTPVEKGADLGRVLVVRQDKTRPLVLEIDVRKMILTGDTTSNIEVRDGDIVYFLRQ